MQKLSIKGIQGFSLTCQDPSDKVAQHTVLSVFKSVLSMQSVGCHGVSEQLMAAGATEEEVKKISHVMAQTVRTRETRIATAEPGPEAHSLPCEVGGSDEEFSNVMCIPGFSKMDTEGLKPSRGACQTPSQKKKSAKKQSRGACQTPSQKRANRKEEVCSLLRLGIWIQLIAVPFYRSLTRIGEVDNPGLAHATAKLFGEQFEAIGQRATNLTSKSEMELTPLLAQVGKCRSVQ